MTPSFIYDVNPPPVQRLLFLTIRHLGRDQKSKTKMDRKKEKRAKRPGHPPGGTTVRQEDKKRKAHLLANELLPLPFLQRSPHPFLTANTTAPVDRVFYWHGREYQFIRQTSLFAMRFSVCSNISLGKIEKHRRMSIKHSKKTEIGFSFSLVQRRRIATSLPNYFVVRRCPCRPLGVPPAGCPGQRVGACALLHVKYSGPGSINLLCSVYWPVFDCFFSSFGSFLLLC